MNQQCIDKINDENMLKSYTTLNEFKDNMVSIMNSQDTGSICKTYLGNPILTVNILFFLNVSTLFWIIGLIQHTFWLIDPYWTILPVLIGHFYRQHPLADPNPSLQANLAMILVYVWAFRLTYSYFRRENFKFGEREDWRYTKMAEDFGNWWYILSFFAVGIAQHHAYLDRYLLYSFDREEAFWYLVAMWLSLLLILQRTQQRCASNALRCSVGSSY